MHEAAITEPSPMPVPVCDDCKSSNFGGIVRNFKKPGVVAFCCKLPADDAVPAALQQIHRPIT
jgi:hypothetical protein